LPGDVSKDRQRDIFLGTIVKAIIIQTVFDSSAEFTITPAERDLLITVPNYTAFQVIANFFFTPDGLEFFYPAAAEEDVGMRQHAVLIDVLLDDAFSVLTSFAAPGNRQRALKFLWSGVIDENAGEIVPLECAQAITDWLFSDAYRPITVVSGAGRSGSGSSSDEMSISSGVSMVHSDSSDNEEYLASGLESKHISYYDRLNNALRGSVDMTGALWKSIVVLVAGDYDAEGQSLKAAALMRFFRESVA
jgi:hypothetical protein